VSEQVFGPLITGKSRREKRGKSNRKTTLTVTRENPQNSKLVATQLVRLGNQPHDRSSPRWERTAVSRIWYGK